ncbi:hypothetical protein [Ferrimicrobium acidiphilum]|jgi:hypothetical protein|uniref:hypothetical protein n=1 Tax=Ferrimicrobium acidiphilum TaxID=121039 RepID=UPI0023F15DEE|nr:hypothetical protein [Ferrimicrobium acidiphilum]
MRLKARKFALGALAGGASLAMLALTTTGYSAWSSSLPVVESISTISGIPAPTNVAIAHKSGTYTITWDIPSGASYGGVPIAQSFEIQGSSTGKPGTWSTIATVPGTTDSYSTAATSSISYYRVVTVDNGWVSSYSGGTAAPPTGIPAPATTVYVPQTVYNPPPNYCGTNQYYHCQINQVSGDVAGFWISIARPYPHVRNDIEPIARYSSISNGAIEITSVPESNVNYYGVGSWQAFGDAFGSSAASTPTYVDSGGTMVPEPYYCNPYDSNPYRYNCPYTNYGVFVSSSAVFANGATYSPDFSVGDILWNQPSISSPDYGLPFEPSCSNYPASGSAYNYNSYVATCVTPYDSSYQEYTTTQVPTQIN